MVVQPEHLHGKVHAILAVGALMALVVTTSFTNKTLTGSIQSIPDRVFDIAIEHRSPSSLKIEMSKLSKQALINFTNESDHTIYMNLPEEWKRREVKDVPLSHVLSEKPIFEFVRWSIPGGATVSFFAPEGPDNLLIHNPSKVPLSIRYIAVNMRDERTLQDSILVKDHSVLLWEEISWN